MSTADSCRPQSLEFLADALTPVAVYRRLAAASAWSFLLESVTGGEQVSRFSFLGAWPREIYRLYPERLELEVDGRREPLAGPPLEALRRVLGRFRAAPGPIPFTGGLVGYFGYDLVRMVERLPAGPAAPHALPVALLAHYDSVVVFDHAHQRVIAIANELDGMVDGEQARERLRRLAALLTASSGSEGVAVPPPQPARMQEARASLDGASYRRAVEKAKEYIAAGDIFQVVLARRWCLASQASPLSMYRALRMVNPSPYMVLFQSPEVSLVGASPEMLVRKSAARLETRPIAGTRPRGDDLETDDLLAAELLADPKERAEHVMLVDLGRNDVGRVARPGSVELACFMEVERYSHVMHLVSSVAGELAPGRDGLDALLACFPAGTVSGAPKIRAMEIIDELECEARGPYAGAVGYFSYTGDLDTCITIRTLVVRNGEASVSAGAGIVADSVPEREERETESKAAALLAAVALAERIEERP